MVTKKNIAFYLLGATALTFAFVGFRRILSNKPKNEIKLSDSDYTLTYEKYKSKDSKNNGITFEYSFKNQSSANKIEHLNKESFNIFDRYKVDVDSLTNRPFFDLTITDLKNPTDIVKKSVRV
jgi:hypothetical protein